MTTREPEVSERDLEQLCSFFRLLSDKTRLNILFRLAGGERNVTALCDEMTLPQPTVSHHLSLLRMSNIVGNRRNGKQVFYALNGRSASNEQSVLAFNVEGFSVKVVMEDRPG